MFHLGHSQHIGAFGVAYDMSCLAEVNGFMARSPHQIGVGVATLYRLSEDQERRLSLP